MRLCRTKILLSLYVAVVPTVPADLAMVRVVCTVLCHHLNMQRHPVLVLRVSLLGVTDKAH